MSVIRGFRRLSLLIALAWAASGCGPGAPTAGTPEAGSAEALRQVGEAYRSYSVAKNKPPQKMADLLTLRQVAQAGAAAAKSGAIVVLWDARMTDLSEEGSKDAADEVLAYEKDVPTQGGQVLMLNRTVKTMTADEFKSAKKAGKEGPPPSGTTKG